MNKQEHIKKMLDLAKEIRQNRTLLIYNICQTCKDKQEILEVLESELKEIGVFNK